jgi:hypothetical protein
MQRHPALALGQSGAWQNSEIHCSSGLHAPPGVHEQPSLPDAQDTLTQS